MTTKFDFPIYVAEAGVSKSRARIGRWDQLPDGSGTFDTWDPVTGAWTPGCPWYRPTAARPPTLEELARAGITR